MNAEFDKFKNLTYESMKSLAKDATLADCERVGFPKIYREGREPQIWKDILSKLTNLQRKDQVFLDIGPGCSELLRISLQYCVESNIHVLLCDSTEMLEHTPDLHHVEKIVGPFPLTFDNFKAWTGKINAILSYSVAQMVFEEANLWLFIDKCLSLLAPEGQLLIGDLPNESKRKRFYSSDSGISFHQRFTGTLENPPVDWLTPADGSIDDAIILAILARCRSKGFDAYVLPQDSTLNFANRREDLLIMRP